MYTKKELIQNIESMKIDPYGTLLVHSSMKSIGDVKGGADTILDVFSEYMKDGLLLFPTHSWKFIHYDAQKPVFDVRGTPSCVGILGNLFMKREGVLRSLHPTHSVAALGKSAADYISGEELAITPCPASGCWGKLYSHHATILFLGCTLRSNTFIHHVEEKNNIPDRVRTDTYRIKIIDENGHEHFTDMHAHHSSAGDISENYDKLEKPFVFGKAIYCGAFGDAACIIGDAVKMADITSKLLKQAPNMFADNTPVPESLYR